MPRTPAVAGGPDVAAKAVSRSASALRTSLFRTSLFIRLPSLGQWPEQPTSSYPYGKSPVDDPPLSCPDRVSLKCYPPVVWTNSWDRCDPVEDVTVMNCEAAGGVPVRLGLGRGYSPRGEAIAAQGATLLRRMADIPKPEASAISGHFKRKRE